MMILKWKCSGYYSYTPVYHLGFIWKTLRLERVLRGIKIRSNIYKHWRESVSSSTSRETSGGVRPNSAAAGWWDHEQETTRRATDTPGNFSAHLNYFVIFIPQKTRSGPQTTRSGPRSDYELDQIPPPIRQLRAAPHIHLIPPQRSPKCLTQLLPHTS